MALLILRDARERAPQDEAFVVLLLFDLLLVMMAANPRHIHAVFIRRHLRVGVHHTLAPGGAVIARGIIMHRAVGIAPRRLIGAGQILNCISQVGLGIEQDL